jgi:hypothetical protein
LIVIKIFLLGGDEPEDFVGAFEIAAGLSWKSDIKFVWIIK